MKWSNGIFFRLLLSLALLCAGLSSSYPQDAAPLPQTQSDRQLIERLLKDLTDSSQEAANILRDSQLQLLTFDQLKAAYNSLALKLPSYEQTITTLQSHLDQSDTSLSKAQQDLAQAQKQASDLQSQLQTLSLALSNYKSATDKEVRNLELENGGWQIGAFIGVGAAGGAIAGKGDLLDTGIGAASGVALWFVGHLFKAW